MCDSDSSNVCFIDEIELENESTWNAIVQTEEWN